MYADDYGGGELEGRCSYSYLGLPETDRSDAAWLDPYLRSRQVWRCPNDWHPVEEHPRTARRLQSAGVEETFLRQQTPVSQTGHLPA